MPDPQLQKLARAARNGNPTPIVVSVGGTIISGLMRPVEDFADEAVERIESNVRTLLEGAPDTTPEEIEERVTALKEATDLREAPEESPDWITIVTATVWLGGRQSDGTHAVRVQLSSVDAWWIPEKSIPASSA
jgi:hypothetical protein